MAKRTNQSDKIVVDSIFSIPRGAEDAMVANPSGTAVPPPNQDPATPGTMFSPQTESMQSDQQFFLQSPDTFSVFDQVLRRAPGGQMVVDIVVQTEDIIGANEYEIQIVKVS